MDKKKLKTFHPSREQRPTDRPIDRLMAQLGVSSPDGDGAPTKKKFETPDAIPPTPDGNKPSVRKPRRPGFGPSM